MSNKRKRLTGRAQRPVLSDTLPFEVPPTFSNKHFYRFIERHDVRLAEGFLSWTAASPSLDPLMALIFGIKADARIESVSVMEWGRARQVRRVKVSAKTLQQDTIPFRFRVRHKEDGFRALSVMHPRSQLSAAEFYRRYSALIIYYCSLSAFSIRRPVSVATHTYYADATHKASAAEHDGVEEEDREYEQIGSYFVYRRYSNIHKFFESYQYHRAEKKYNGMVQLDISKCFDSIYTHSVVWAVLGKGQTKFALDRSKASFAGRFDQLMQLMNERETNGIIIGPEFSRVFAEIILQAVDVEIERRLHEDAKLVHKVDYEVFRYVDDFFVFYNQESTYHKFIEVAQVVLSEYKLAINSGKFKVYSKPIITEITIAKDRISAALNDAIRVSSLRESASRVVIAATSVSSLVIESANEPGQAAAVGSVVVGQTLVQSDPEPEFDLAVDASRLIIKFKTVLLEAKVEYGDVLNYAFAVLERKLSDIASAYSNSSRSPRSQFALTRALLGIIEFMFFAYAASPRVNHTIRLVRAITLCVDMMNGFGVNFELKHFVFKYIHDNAVQQLTKHKVDTYREVESLYLFCALSHLGREYWLPETAVAEYFGLVEDAGVYTREGHLSHFSITVAMYYVRDKVRYERVRRFLERHSVEKLTYMKAHCPNDAEALMLFLDLIVCPYCSQATKESLGAVYGYTAADLPGLIGSNEQWFTAWADFDLARELDAKRSREVY